MREVLETPGKTAALITPDPSVARRVSAELARWGVEAEDSAGRTLGESEAGALSRLVLEAAVDLTPLSAQALIVHPAARFGRAPADCEAAARALELGILRAAPMRALDDLDKAFAAARAAAGDRHAHPAIRTIGEEERVAAERLARELVAALEPLRAVPAASLRARLEAHRSALGAILAAPEAEASAPQGLETLDQLFDEWSEAAGDGFACTLPEYAALIDDALAGVRAPPARGGHPRLRILGLLEARLLSFDRALLAGLDENVWPPAVETDAFLNRPMRAKLGLSAPERRIGQTAHDFVAALGAREVVPQPREEAERRADRRLALSPADRGGRRREGDRGGLGRGESYLRWARALDQPAGVRARQAACAAPARGNAAALAQRHPGRDPAPRSLRDLCRAHSEASGDGAGRTRTWRARGGRGLARRAAGLRRALPVERVADGGAGGSCPPRPRALRRAARTPGFRGARLAQYREGDRLRPRFRIEEPRRDSNASGSSARASSSSRSAMANRSD